MSEETRDTTKLYEVTNRDTGDKCLAVATNAQDACALLGWMIGDCFVTLYRTVSGQYHGESRFDLVAVPCEVCPYQWAACEKPDGTKCPVTSDVPDLNEWLKKISLAHLCAFVGEDMLKNHHRLHRNLIPFEEAIKELTPSP